MPPRPIFWNTPATAPSIAPCVPAYAANSYPSSPVSRPSVIAWLPSWTTAVPIAPGAPPRRDPIITPGIVRAAPRAAYCKRSGMIPPASRSLTACSTAAAFRLSSSASWSYPKTLAIGDAVSAPISWISASPDASTSPMTPSP